ncbi:MAG: DUF3750 domain-containing protein [Proteobacteria bacterium]|nr:MAG: DUF3750 domain-containing protein [Pseudomonadota bacterium]QKK11717.1 MAG: DUF3750 domain-containing protein [Pseudomonadota bacterium]
MRRVIRITLRGIIAVIAVIAVGLSLAWATNPNSATEDWRSADRSSAGIAPDPKSHREAIVQLYAARAFRWRGTFSVHTWLALKPEDAQHFTVVELLGWRAYRDQSAVVVRADIPDRRWFNSMPQLIAEQRGPLADQAIAKLLAAAESYPRRFEYGLWPGPNSNTFIAYLLRHVPELGFAMPPNALGKDFLIDAHFVAATPSGTGYQFSLGGALGLLLAQREGLEINVLGLTLGFDPRGPALVLPGVGRLGG